LPAPSDELQPLSTLLTGFIGAVDSKAEPVQPPTKTAFGEAIALLFPATHPPSLHSNMCIYVYVPSQTSMGIAKKTIIYNLRGCLKS
jgi:hypothetical protein